MNTQTREAEATIHPITPKAITDELDYLQEQIKDLTAAIEKIKSRPVLKHKVLLSTEMLRKKILADKTKEPTTEEWDQGWDSALDNLLEWIGEVEHEYEDGDPLCDSSREPLGGMPL